MEAADSTEPPLPPPRAPLSTPSPGYSLPIRAPLTIDSDSDYLSINDQTYSRTTSFNSTNSSTTSSDIDIDISSYGDEHTSLFEEGNDGFVAHSDDEIVIGVESSSFDRAFVRYLDGNYVNERLRVCESTVCRPFVKVLTGESSSSDLGAKLSVPIAPLTRDTDSDSETETDTDIGSVESEEIVQKVTMAPKVRSYNGEEEDELVVSDDDDDIAGSENFSCVSTEAVANEGFDIECLNEVVKLSESCASSFDLERFDAQTVSSSNNEIETESSSVKLKLSEADGLKIVSDSSNEIEIDSVKLAESDELCFDSERTDAQGVSDLKSEIETESFNVKLSESDELSSDSEGDGVKIVSLLKHETEIETCRVKLAESDYMGFDSERTDTQVVSDSDSEIEFEASNVKLAESDELGFGSERTDAQVVSDSNSEIKVETFNVKLAESDEPGFDSERTDTRVVSDSNSEIEFEAFNVKLAESDELDFDSERTDEQVVSESNSEIKVETSNVKLAESDEPDFDSERTDAQAVSDSNGEIETETFNFKPSESDYPSFDFEREDAKIVSHSNNEIETEKIKESEQKVGSEKEEKMLMNMQRIRAKFLRLILSNQLTTKVNKEGGNDKFDFELTVLAIGKTGAGKSATINSIFGESKATTNAFHPGTTAVQEITGNIDGIKLRVIDTPGLKPSSYERSHNLRVLKSIKRSTRKHAPDVVLYVDRLDTQDIDDSHLLTLITGSLGSWVWHGCVIVLTHAGCVLPNESLRGFVAQRCQSIREQIVRSGGGHNRRLARPVWLLDNYLSYEHDIMDLDCGKVLACLDQDSEDDGCDQVPLSEPANRLGDVIKGRVERKTAYFGEQGYRVKLLGNDRWSLGCRLCI